LELTVHEEPKTPPDDAEEPKPPDDTEGGRVEDELWSEWLETMDDDRRDRAHEQLGDYSDCA